MKTTGFHGIVGKIKGIKYGWELVLFHKIRAWDDGLSLFDFTLDMSWYKSDHRPSYGVHLVIWNITIVEFTIYNVDHAIEE